MEYDNDGNISTWGFQCARDPGKEKTQYQCSGRLIPSPPTNHIKAFLRLLYGHLKHSISIALGLTSFMWSEMGVEFHYTLSDLTGFLHSEKLLSHMCHVKDVLRDSDIGTGGSRHSSIIDRTETEAAATAISRHLTKPGP